MNIKKSLLTLAALLALAAPVKAQEIEEPKIRVGINNVVEREKPITTQAFASCGKNKALFEQTGKSQNYGLNLEHESLRLNLGLKDQKKDQSRALVEFNQPYFFLGSELQVLQDKKEKAKAVYTAGIKPHERLSLEGTVDTDGNFRSVLFVDPFEDSRLGVGGGVTEDSYEVNTMYSQRLTDRTKVRGLIRVGNKKFLGGRLWIGQNMGAKSALILGVQDTFFNNLSDVSDITSPLSINGFNYASADAVTGQEDLDFGFDLKYDRDEKKERVSANVAVNLGDCCKLKDFTLSPEYHRDIKNKVNGARAGASVGIFDTGFKVWYQGFFDEYQDSRHTVFVGFEKEF